MSQLYTEISQAASLLSAEGGAYKAIHTELLNLIDNFKSDKINEPYYKLQLNNWFRTHQTTEHEHHSKIHEWYNKLKLEGSKIKT